MCPGQGAQRVGMGRDLAERFPAARDTFAAIDDALGVRALAAHVEGPEDELTLTHNTQPAILAHSAAVWAVVKDELRRRARGRRPQPGRVQRPRRRGHAQPPPTAASLVRRRGRADVRRRHRRAPARWPPCSASPPSQVDEACNEASGHRRGGGRGQSQRPRSDGHLGRSARRRSRRRGLQGPRRQAGGPAQGERGVSLAADGAGGRRAARRADRRDVRRPGVAGHRQRERRGRCGPAWTPSGCWSISSRRRCAGSPACRRRRRSARAPRSSRSARATCSRGCSSASCPAPPTVTLGTADEVEQFLRMTDHRPDRQGRVRHRQHPRHRARHRPGAARRRGQGGRRGAGAGPGGRGRRRAG